MFGLFKRTKIEIWEIDLLRNVVIKLPSEYSNLNSQINDGLFRGVLEDVSDIPGYVAFTYHSSILKKYDKEKEQDFKLTNIKVYDKKSLGYIQYEVYISSGTISGYSLGGGKKSSIDVSKIDVSGVKKVFIGNSDYNRTIHLLNEEEKKLISPSEVYSIYIGGKEFFHIKDLEDGNFIGIDEDKIVFKISHDPLETKVVNKKISDILK